MNLEEIYYISQIVSTLALVLSVIYLGRQTHLAGANQIAQMHQARSEQFHEVVLRLTDAEFGPLVEAATHGDPRLSDDQVRRFYFYTVTILRIFEEMFRHWRAGMIGTDRWETSRRTLLAMLRAPGYRASYIALRSALDSDFVAMVDGMVAAATQNATIDPVADWRAALAQSLAPSQRASA